MLLLHISALAAIDGMQVDGEQGILDYMLGRERMPGENGEELAASTFQPIFHVEHAAGGSEDEPLNIWSIVLLTQKNDPRYEEPFFFYGNLLADEDRNEEAIPYLRKAIGNRNDYVPMNRVNPCP